MREPDAFPRASVPQQGFKIDHIKSFSLARTETSMRRIWGPLMFRGTSWLLFFPWALVGTLNFSAQGTINNHKGEKNKIKTWNQMLVETLKSAPSFTSSPGFFFWDYGIVTDSCLHLERTYIWGVNHGIGLRVEMKIQVDWPLNHFCFVLSLAMLHMLLWATNPPALGSLALGL